MRIDQQTPLVLAHTLSSRCEGSSLQTWRFLAPDLQKEGCERTLSPCQGDALKFVQKRPDIH